MTITRPATVDFSGVSHQYVRGGHALEQLDLRIEDGEFFALLGPSGSGKTTLLMLIAGFITPSTGDILIGEEKITSIAPNRRDIGIVFQDYALFPHMTVWDNVAYPLKARRVARSEQNARVTEALRLVRLSEKANSYPAELSGGQKQRVALARAIVFGPRVLLMDEPLGALDRSMREEMKHELKRLHAELGVTVVYVTHDQGEAMALADRVAVMKDGKLIQVGPPPELYYKPANRFIAEFVGDSTVIEAQWRDGNAQIGSVAVASKDWHGGDGPILLAIQQNYVVITPVPKTRDGHEPGVEAEFVDVIFNEGRYIATVRLDDGQKIRGIVDGQPPLAKPGTRLKVTWPVQAATPLSRG
ncbi:putative spermidine/putrescine transport system ATP-binding protein [Microbacterium sp. BE35]|uniref:ABC transporter ATP-binding protein n=1 Tax=Microbacterium sp. BE35 TaxID=2817773 RepID=UPI0028551797|nr:ABC transporter ATP-binding protein [Microbacterium sp. BE35]MDR7188260.1 putative spermidine/putrescine transport system ATP-binding protein [Microbacterium sp. BE35]